LGGLALVLALSLTFQALPAFALGSPTTDVVTPLQLVPTRIQTVALLETYPARLKITGTLPSACYQLRVSVPLVGSVQGSGGARPLIVWVRGALLSGSVCPPGLQPFSTTVTLDPQKLNLAPGNYVALVNPVNGQSVFRAEFMVLPQQLTIVRASIIGLVLEAHPAQFKIIGTLPASCYQVRILAPQVAGKVISVFVQGVAPKGAVCGILRKPFSSTVTLNPTQLKLPLGKYAVLFNPINGVSKFRSEINVFGNP
jgi:hypothetical protein